MKKTSTSTKSSRARAPRVPVTLWLLTQRSVLGPLGVDILRSRLCGVSEASPR